MEGAPSNESNGGGPPRPFSLPHTSPFCPESFEFWVDWFLESLFPDMPCMKRVYRDKKASFHWSAARNKERFSSR